MTMLDVSIKTALFKEAEYRVSVPSTTEQRDPVVGILNREAEERLEKLKSVKEASVIKWAHALGTGRSDLNNSVVNLEWQDPGRDGKLKQREEQIKMEIEEQYAPYMFRELNKKKASIPPSLVRMPIPEGDQLEISDDQSEVAGEPEASLVMRFKYRRRILPIQSQDADAFNRATDAFNSLERVCPGIWQFIKTVEDYDIGLNPYYHASVFNEEKGGLIPSWRLNKFVRSEAQRDHRFYKQHVSKMDAAATGRDSRITPIKLAYQPKHNRVFKNEDADLIPTPNMLRRALADKVQQGYILNVGTQRAGSPPSGLKKEINELLEKRKHIMGLDGPQLTKQQQDHLKLLEQHYNALARNVIRNFNAGCMWTPGEAPKGSYPWGTRNQGGQPQYRPGLQIKQEGPVISKHDEMGQALEQAQNKHARCSGLSMEELRLALKCCTVHSGEGTPTVGPDEFYIEDFSMTYMPNGLDSNPTKEGGSMLTMPALRKGRDVYEVDEQGNPVPETNAAIRAETGSKWKVKRYGDVMYDPDNCNGGRIHLVKNFYGQNGGFKELLTAYGEKAIQWLSALRERSNLSRLTPEAQHAWAVSVGGVGNRYPMQRTSADTVLDLIQKYPDYESFFKNVLAKSMAMELQAYENAAKQPGSPLATLRQKYDNGEISWEDFGRGLVDQNLIRQVAEEDRSRMKPEDFDLFKRYGHPVAKMMDFAMAVVTSCCREQVSTRVLGRRNNQQRHVEYLYGRKYSASSGSGSGGQIMLGLKYAFPAPVITEDPNLAAVIKRERRKAHSIDRPKGETSRRTEFPQTMQGQPGQAMVPEGMQTDEATMERERYEGDPVIMKVVERLTYFIGEAGTSDGQLSRQVESSDWYTLVDEFIRRFPDVESKLHILINPINANLAKIGENNKRAMDTVRAKLENMYKSAGKPISLEVLYQAANGKIELLSADKIEFDAEMQNAEQTQLPSQENAPTAEPVQPAAVAPVAPVSTGPTPGQDIQTLQQPVGFDDEVPDMPMFNEPTPARAPVEPQVNPMAMPGSSESGHIRKRDKNRNLLRADVVGRMQKVADEFDRRGLTDIADKLDQLMTQLKAQG